MTDDQKSSRLFFLIFMVFVIIGCLSALAFMNANNPENQKVIVLPTQPEGQQIKSILVIGVDELSAPPSKLMSVWLVSHSLNTTWFSLQPLYPPDRPAPHSAVAIDRRDPAAVDKLIETLKLQFEWDETVWIDSEGMKTLISTANSDLGSEHLSKLPSSWRSPSSALQEQQNLLMQLCGASSSYASLEVLQGLLHLYPDNLFLDIDEFLLVSEWENLIRSGFQLECEFPPQQ